mmetsp:Transcript_7489/g.18446  ORF Transcript_7489/g.18446 Transcript_7489/m.18446 type:complete len:769 (+) Transcript_7489:62-2368(+)
MEGRKRDSGGGGSGSDKNDGNIGERNKHFYYESYSYESISEAVTRRRPLTSKRSHNNNDDDDDGDDGDSEQQDPLHNSDVDGSGGGDGKETTGKDNGDRSHRQQRRKLRRTLSLADLIFYGVGCSVGAGIYSLVGIGAKLAGPAVSLSFLFTGMSCCFTSLAYAEFASLVPLSGSAYTFTYVSFGELAGWLVGWNLTLGYAVSAAVVARSWASYVVEFISGMLLNNVIGADGGNENGESISTGSDSNSDGHLERLLRWSIHAPVPFIMEDYECCPLSMVIIGFCTFVLITGAKESSRFNTAMTILNLSVLTFVVLSGLVTDTIQVQSNLQPFFPHGMNGVGRAAGLVFFSYLGFDMVSCLSEEVKNPERNMPIGIIGSLGASMAIYTTVSLVVVGMAPIVVLGEDTPIVNALLGNGCCTDDQMQFLQDESGSNEYTSIQQCLTYACEPVVHKVLVLGSRLVSAGAMFGLTTATFSCLMGQPRIFYSMAVDGLLFKIYAKVSPRTGVPTIGTVMTGIATAIVACLIDLESLANVISLGTLMVFTFVNAGVIILRTTPPVINDDGTDDENGSTYDTARISANTSSMYTGGASAPHERSPLVRNPEAAVVARSLGLIKLSSREIRADLKHHHMIDDSYIERLRLQQNGTWPHLLTFAFTLLATVGSLGLNHGWSVIILSSMAIMMIALTFIMSTRIYHASPQPTGFSCPLVPYVPLMGILCNGYMMGSMPASTWSAISAWLFVGVVFYFSYGLHHSELRMNKKKRNLDAGI